MKGTIVVVASTDVRSESGSLVCPSCRYPNEDDAKYCIICGRPLIEDLLSEDEEKSINESWNEIKTGKVNKFDSVDEYAKSLDD
jgi:zinc-ribbon domain